MRRILRYSIPVLLSVACCTCCIAQKKFDFNPACQQAYKEIIRLKLATGQRLLDAEKKTNPGNLVPYFLENYIDFFVLFFNEDPAEYTARERHEAARLQLMDEGPESDPFYLFTKSIIHFQWAAIRIKAGKHWDAGWEFRRSFLQSKDNHKKFPAFAPNAMINGTMQVAAATIPDGYKWLSNLMGISGSITGGMDMLRGFLTSTDPWAMVFHEEAVFYYLYLEFYIENKKAAVFDFLSAHSLDLSNNHLFAFLAANLGVNGQRSAYAKTILLQKNSDTAYIDLPVWDLEMGYVKLNHLEPDAAMYLQRFLDRFRGNFYVKDVLQKLSWFYYLQGSQQRANAYRAQVLTKGNLETEADKQAQNEAESGKWPDKLLLQSRLLNDGGYNQEALDLLKEKNAGDFLQPDDKLEFVYRLGRIYDDLGRNNDAITAYLSAMEAGMHNKAYYAARAALQVGYIYEKLGDKKKAGIFFQKCISYRDHDYKNSLDQKAKAGIKRCLGE